MKRVGIAILFIGASVGAFAARSPAHAGAMIVRPYHVESSIRAVHTARGYRIVARSAPQR